MAVLPRTERGPSSGTRPARYRREPLRQRPDDAGTTELLRRRRLGIGWPPRLPRGRRRVLLLGRRLGCLPYTPSNARYLNMATARSKQDEAGQYRGRASRRSGLV